MNAIRAGRAVSLLITIPVVLTAQQPRYPDPVRLKNWVAPLYWQLAQAQQGPSDRPLAPDPICRWARTRWCLWP